MSKVVQQIHTRNRLIEEVLAASSTLREAAVASGWLTAEQFDAWVIPGHMVGGR